MPRSPGREVVTVLLDEANQAYRNRSWRKSLEAAEGAVSAARRVGDAMLLVRALYAEGKALWILGDVAAAMVRDVTILTMAEDPATRDELARTADWYVAMARYSLVQDVFGLTRDPERMREMLGVLDTAERWLAATGHTDWRAGLLLWRARIHDRLGDRDKAIGFAQEALAAKEREPRGTPGYYIGDHRVTLASFLRTAGRDDEAVAIYEAVLDDPVSRTYELVQSHKGLADCALDAGRNADAVVSAAAAVRLSEAQDDLLVIYNAMYTLVRAHRATGDLDQAWEVAVRYLATARHDGSARKLYYAERTMVDLALDRGDVAAADDLMGKLKEHGLAIDRADGGTMMAVEVARRYKRLANTRKTQR